MTYLDDWSGSRWHLLETPGVRERENQLKQRRQAVQNAGEDRHRTSLDW